MKSQKKSVKNKSIKKPGHTRRVLRLYVVGKTPNCTNALKNLRRICDEYFPKDYYIEVIDLLKSPHLAKEDQILAIPSVIKVLPTPIRKMIGDLSDTEQVLIGLDLRIIS